MPIQQTRDKEYWNTVTSGGTTSNEEVLGMIDQACMQVVISLWRKVGETLVTI